MVDIAKIDPDKLAQIMGHRPEDEGLDRYGGLIPGYARVQIPLNDKATLDNAADILLGLAHSLRAIARRTDLKPWEGQLQAHMEIKAANARMQGPTTTRRQK